MDALGQWWDSLSQFFGANQALLRVILIVIGGVTLHFVVRMAIKRIVQQVVSGVKKLHGAVDTQALESSPVEAMRQVQRTRTLGLVLNNFAGWAIGIMVVLMVLSELGLSITPLIASAGILGAALGFGAQSLVKDTLNGLFMVFEDQLGVGDVVNVGQVSGVVERVGIRITEIRDVDGTLWFVRNGEIVMVGNYSQDWARVVFDVPIPRRANVSALQEDMLRAATEVCRETSWRRKVLEEPELWGIESISPDSVVVRLVVKVRAGEQWALKRALHQAITHALDHEGVDVPPLVEPPERGTREGE